MLPDNIDRDPLESRVGFSQFSSSLGAVLVFKLFFAKEHSVTWKEAFCCVHVCIYVYRSAVRPNIGAFDLFLSRG